MLYPQSINEVDSCEKKQFLLKNVKNQGLVKAVDFLYSQEFDKAYSYIKDYRATEQQHSNPFALLLEADVLYGCLLYTSPSPRD